VAVERAAITFDVVEGKGYIRIGDVAEARLTPFQNATGARTSLHDSVFSTIPGSPAYVGKAEVFRRDGSRHGLPDVAVNGQNAAYFAVWLAFAGVALLGDAGVHALVERWGWLHTHEGLVLAGALGLAGAVQFTPITRRCLRVCRDPRGFLFQHYRRGVAAAWWLGVRHGAFCVGCCWALMLIMFAVGAGNLWWMVALTAVMVAEKITRWGPRLVAPVGVLLLFAAGWAGLDALAPPAAGDLPIHVHGSR
jgi:predicted metal-binding membrane protein